jgi:hypothetical protein
MFLRHRPASSLPFLLITTSFNLLLLPVVSQGQSELVLTAETMGLDEVSRLRVREIAMSLNARVTWRKERTNNVINYELYCERTKAEALQFGMLKDPDLNANILGLFFPNSEDRFFFLPRESILASSLRDIRRPLLSETMTKLWSTIRKRWVFRRFFQSHADVTRMALAVRYAVVKDREVQALDVFVEVREKNRNKSRVHRFQELGYRLVDCGWIDRFPLAYIECGKDRCNPSPRPTESTNGSGVVICSRLY